MWSDVQVRVQIREVLDRFNDPFSRRNPQVLAQFVPSADVLLVGSNSIEIATGSQELEALFARMLARDATFS